MALTKLNNQSLSAVTAAGLPSGTVLQVVQNTEEGTQTSTNSTSYVDANLNCSITPSSTNSKILVQVTSQQKTSSGGDYGLFGLKRGSTDVKGLSLIHISEPTRPY